MNTGAMILAAGNITNERGVTPLTHIGSVSMVERIYQTLRTAHLDQVVLITGYNGKQLEAALKDRNIVFLRNPNYMTTDMLASIKIGLRYFGNTMDRILIAPVDVPLFTGNTVKALFADPSADVTIPVFQKKQGHPVCIANSAVQPLLHYQEGRFDQALLSSNFRIHYINLDDPGILADLGSCDADADWVAQHSHHLLRPEVQVKLVKERDFFDPLSASLLQQIKNTGSVRRSCARLNISYSRGWSILQTAEKQLGFQLTHRVQGGSGGGSAVLTSEGEEFLYRYQKFQREMEASAEQIFVRWFADYMVP